jgi:hypothetical protein
VRCQSVIFLFFLLALTFAGCAITFDPKPMDIVPFKERAQTQAQDDLTVTVAVPTLEEAKAISGVDLSCRGMRAGMGRGQERGELSGLVIMIQILTLPSIWYSVVRTDFQYRLPPITGSKVLLACSHVALRVRRAFTDHQNQAIGKYLTVLKARWGNLQPNLSVVP